MGRLSRLVFGLSPEEVTAERRGFHAEGAVREHLERVGHSFLAGYHAALEHPRLDILHGRLEAFDPLYRGFAYEGAAMSLVLTDALVPGRGRFRAFLDGPGGPHVYMAHVGAGWAMARLPVAKRRALRELDPLLRWLAYDGYGFHQGYFDPRRSFEGPRRRPRGVRGYAGRAFDQGLGRSLWFYGGADVERVERTIASFAEERRRDLWSGVGLAATYAGGAEIERLAELAEAAGEHRLRLAQGSAFAAEARRRAGNPTPHAEAACELFCGLSLEEASDLTWRTRSDLPGDGDEPAYEIWRLRVQQELALAAGAPRLASRAAG